MREELNENLLDNVTGGAIDFVWSKDTQSGTVSSTVTGQTFTFGRDKVNAVYNYVMSHRQDPDVDQMNALAAIING